MQEGRTVSPLGPVVLPREEADMRAGLSLPPQERRHVLLHVRTAAEPFVRYENARQQQHSPSPALPILRPLDNGSEATFHEMESARSKRMEDDEAEEEEEEEQEE